MIYNDSSNNTIKIKKINSQGHSGVKVDGQTATCTAASWKYSANGAVLTASCSRKATCKEADKTLTISVNSPVYSGNTAAVNIGTTQERTAWKDAGLILPTTVEHYNGTTKLASAPTTAGIYTAKVTYKGATASVKYTITDKELTKAAAPPDTSSFTKKGKTSQIKAAIVKDSKNKKLLSKTHGPSLSYYSTNTKIATVTSKGKIKGMSKGTCYIYVTALNGVNTRVKVTVK